MAAYALDPMKRQMLHPITTEISHETKRLASLVVMSQRQMSEEEIEQWAHRIASEVSKIKD